MRRDVAAWNSTAGVRVARGQVEPDLLFPSVFANERHEHESPKFLRDQIAVSQRKAVHRLASRSITQGNHDTTAFPQLRRVGFRQPCCSRGNDDRVKGRFRWQAERSV